MQLTSSPNTGAPKAEQSAAGKQLAAGSSHSERGCVTSQSDGVVARLLEADTSANDQAVEASLTRRHGLQVRAIREARYPQGERSYLVTTGYDIAEQDGADLEGALDTVKLAQTPAPEKALIGWLAELSVQVAYRAQTEFNGELTLRVYARNLADYPADVVRDTLREWPGVSKWWPTWHELKERLDRKRQRRRRLEIELMKRIREGRKAEPDHVYDPNIAKGLEDLLASIKPKDMS